MDAHKGVVDGNEKTARIDFRALFGLINIPKVMFYNLLTSRTLGMLIS